MIKKILNILLLIFVIYIWNTILIWTNTFPKRDKLLQKKFDLLQQESVPINNTQIEIKLNTLPFYTVEDLPQDFISFSGLGDSLFQDKMEDVRFYEISQDKIYKYILPNVRFRDLFPKSDYYKKVVMKEKEFLYFTIKKELLYKMLKLQKLLNKEFYKYENCKIISGFRYPTYNGLIGGATFSRHIIGDAFDLYIKDIDNDGIADSTDKKIVLQLLEEKVINEEGGIGRYPNRNTIHYDVRGFKARW